MGPLLGTALGAGGVLCVSAPVAAAVMWLCGVD